MRSQWIVINTNTRPGGRWHVVSAFGHRERGDAEVQRLDAQRAVRKVYRAGYVVARVVWGDVDEETDGVGIPRDNSQLPFDWTGVE